MHHVMCADASWFSCQWDLLNLKMPKEARTKTTKKRRQQLSLARQKAKQSNEEDYQVPSQSASMRKLSIGKELDSGEQRASQQWLIVHVARLNELVNGLICPNCAGTGLKINIDPQNQGFCSSLLLECSLCERDGYRKSIYTSTRLQDGTRNDVAFDVNVRMVLLAHELGLGYAALKKISKVLGIPALHLKTYQKHDKRVTGRLWKQG